MYDFSKKKDISANKLIWSDKRCILGFKKFTLAFSFSFLFSISRRPSSAYLLQFRKLDTQNIDKSYIVSAVQVDTLRWRKCWEKERKIQRSGERTALQSRNGGREHGGSQPRRRDVHTRQCTVYHGVAMA